MGDPQQMLAEAQAQQAAQNAGNTSSSGQQSVQSGGNTSSSSSSGRGRNKRK